MSCIDVVRLNMFKRNEDPAKEIPISSMSFWYSTAFGARLTRLSIFVASDRVAQTDQLATEPHWRTRDDADAFIYVRTLHKRTQE